jgi:ABC-type enterochelin transport system permease subunit
MINFIKTMKVLSMLLMVSLVVGGMSLATYTVWKEDNSCNKVIFLKGELSRDINHVNYMVNGIVARIHYCDGTSEDVPTSRIIKVVNK